MQGILNKKGQNQISSLVIGIIILAVTLVIGFVVLGGTQTMVAQVSPSAVTETITNETNAHLNITGYTLDYSTATGFRDPTMTAIWGVEGGIYNLSYTTGNATITSTGVVTNSSATSIANASFSYTYVADSNHSEGYNSTGTIITALAGVTTWIPILIVILIAGVVLGLVTNWGKGKNQGM